jgi:uncharacterized alkaline shock family protein YloU
VTDPGRPADDIWLLLDDPAGHLTCGADVDELLEQAADGQPGQLTEHQRGCPHCQAALQELSHAWEPVRRAAITPVPVPAAVRNAVARQVRGLTADVWYTLDLADGRAARIAGQVVARIASEAARKVPGVRVAFGRGRHSEVAGPGQTAHRHPQATAGVPGRTAVIDLAVAAEYGRELDAIARDVQERVIAELRDKAGLGDVQVNVTVDDIIP